MDGNRKAFRLAIAAGGTGGHVQPVVAVLEELQFRQIPLELLWIGGASGTESDTARKLGIPFKSVQTGKFRRYADWRTPIDAVKVPVGAVQAWRLLRSFRPNVVFATGGHVSSAGAIGGARIAPVITHEQTAILGMATRLNMHFADELVLAFPDAAKLATSYTGKVVVTGNPVRRSILNGNKSRGFAQFGLDPSLPLLYVTGGARGASPLNTRIEAILESLLAVTQVVHQTGGAVANDDARRLAEKRNQLPTDLRNRYVVRDFISDDLADLLAATDLVLARAGAGTVCELAVLGKPAILVPLPGAGGAEQHKNAALLGEVGAAVVIDQEDASPERLLSEITRLLAVPALLGTMSAAAYSRGSPDAVNSLADEILRLGGYQE